MGEKNLHFLHELKEDARYIQSEMYALILHELHAQHKISKENSFVYTLILGVVYSIFSGRVHCTTHSGGRLDASENNTVKRLYEGQSL